MSNVNRNKGAVLAAAAAALFVAAPFAANAGAESMGHCVGGNSCKGQSACKTANSGCQGQNSCKGQGFTQTTEAECEEAGGKFEKV